MSFDTNPTALALFSKPKQKFTVLSLSIMGVGRTNITTKGVLAPPYHPVLGHTVDKGRKPFVTASLFRRPVIVLKGHHPTTGLDESDIPVKIEGGFGTQVVHFGSGVRMWNAGGPESLAEFLAEHCLIHTLPSDQQIGFVTKGGGDAEDISNIILEALPPATDLERVEAPKPPRKAFLTDVMKAQLSEAKPDSMKPLFRVFGGGAFTYVLTNLEDDGDTLWGFCDIGQGCVEYGTVSLRELEERHFPPFGLGMERDRFWEAKGYPAAAELLAGSRLP